MTDMPATGRRLAGEAGWEEYRPEWLYADMGAQCMGILCAGIYPTSSPEQLQYVLNDAQIRVLFVENQEQYDKVVTVRQDCPSLQRIVITNNKGLRELDDAMRMLDLLETESAAQTGGSDLVDLELFATRIAKLYAGNQTQADVGLPPPVQVMTIHKAKGLEFDTVVVPSLHRVPRNEDRRLLVWNEQADPVTGERVLLLAPIREVGAADDGDAIYRLVQRGVLPGFQVAGAWRFQRADIQRWIDSQKPGTAQ